MRNWHRRIGRTLTMLAFSLGGVAPALAHEPLWGEAPTTFAFGIIHPEVRMGWENASQRVRGSTVVENALAMRRTRYDVLASVQFAPRTTLNLKLEIPFASVGMQQRGEGNLRSSGVSGVGDVAFSVKGRFHQRFGEGWKVQQSYVAGLKLPTGERSGRMPDGTRFSPSDQPGSGQFGLTLGYLFDYERVRDTLYFSTIYQQDITGSYRLGSLWQTDLAWGYWIKLATQPHEMGVFLATGFHLEVAGPDHLVTGSDPDSGRTLLGWQMSVIVTQGQAQFRAGAMLPVARHYRGTQLAPEIQFRAGAEILL